MAKIVLNARYFLFSRLVDQILLWFICRIVLKSSVCCWSLSVLLRHTLLITFLERFSVAHLLCVKYLIVCILDLSLRFTTKERTSIRIDNFFISKVLTIVTYLLLVIKHIVYRLRFLDLRLCLGRWIDRLLNLV